MKDAYVEVFPNPDGSGFVYRALKFDDQSPVFEDESEAVRAAQAQYPGVEILYSDQ